MQSITVTLPMSPAVLAFLATQLGADVEFVGEAKEEPKTEEPKTAKRGRPAKAAPKVEESKVEESKVEEPEETSIDFGVEEDKPVKEYTVKDDIIPALHAFLKRHKDGKERAQALLLSYGTKSVHELPKDKFSEIMEKLKA